MRGWQAACLEFPCTFCDAPAGDRCSTRSGLVATYPHVARHRALQRVVDLAGYRDEVDEGYRYRRARIKDLRTLLEQVRPLADRGEQVNTAGWLLPRLRDILTRAEQG